ncbi:FMN-binding negative transcriptional regulator [Pseudoalteromonas sp. SMS1]|uniref:FMN-binding negative transcriptional regulator n=1 Tax=Pseudoalteromonas sp. SMS1 TaxID=2908894 RepID=UPI001F48A707|nr:FMN-binding negative transcriptional regulator [Pseudoalteromonas sp. SMS1]MCF2857055.1 FMN-binding negative transcriptional regulator [Pseudoalteromonas sp. SMS1]
MSYPPKDYTESNTIKLFEIIEHYPLATLICNASGSELHSCHIPLSLCRESLTLFGHANPANPLREFIGKQIHCIFHGPDAYLSPAQVKGIKLPTWDYATVHIEATLQAVTAFEKQVQILQHMLLAFEDNAQPWQLSTVPEKQLIAMCTSLLFFELNITQITGQFKLSQNKPADTRVEIANLLQNRGSTMSTYYQ